MESVSSLFKPAIAAATVVLVAISCWEFYLRQNGVKISYDDASELWADKRAMVYGQGGKPTVFIGSSRIKYDMDIPTWKKTTGEEPVQLAIEGNSPLTVLEDLGNDPDFKGRLIVDVTEEFFFSLIPNFNTEPRDNINYYHKQTYAQKAGFQLNHLLESQFVFLNKRFLSLNAELDNLGVKDRKGVIGDLHFPIDFWNVDFNRQDKMTARFVADTALHNLVTSQWSLVIGKLKNGPKPKINPIPLVIQKAVTAVDKINARGGEVILVRMPSSGPFYKAERELFKKEKYWDALVSATRCKSIYFNDYPSLNYFICPEWSHLSPAQARVFTTAFLKLLPATSVN